MDSSLRSEVVACVSQASFWSPDYVCHSGWLEHGPFAFWLCGTVRPQCFVELGTHYGYSYFAFCQAFNAIGINGAAYAIDTWTGDEHAGYYGDDVFNVVSKHNRKHFAGFSTLIRSPFDDALHYFADGSIDLLHVDGRHFYEDVKHDYETWRHKLAPQAIVVFHDINVRERNFGVWKFFSELASDCPSFSFFHGNGLGVLAPNGNPPERLAPLFSASPAAQGEIRAIYSTLGAGIRWRQSFGSKLESVDSIIAAAPAFGPSFRDDLSWSSNGDTQALRLLDLFEAQTQAASLQQSATSESLVRERSDHAQSIATLSNAHSQALEEVLAAERAVSSAAIERLQDDLAAERAVATKAVERVQKSLAADHAIAAQEMERLLVALTAATDNSTEEQRTFAEASAQWRSEREFLLTEVANWSSRCKDLENWVLALRASSSWRITAPFRIAGKAARTLIFRRNVSRQQIAGPPAVEIEALPQTSSPESPPTAGRLAPHLAVVASYEVWSREFDTPTSRDLVRLSETVGDVPFATVILVFTPGSSAFAGRLANALRHSLGLNFAVAVVCQGITADDAVRITRLICETGIPLVSMDKIEPGTPLIVVDGAAVPRAHGLRVFVDTLSRNSAVQVVYSDEDVLDADGIPSNPWFKPQFSAHLVAAGVLLGRMVAMSGAAAETVRSNLRSADFNVGDVLRVATLSAGEAGTVSVPHVLFHNIAPPPESLLTLSPQLETIPAVSIIIPTKNAWNFLGPCLTSLEITEWPRSRLEIIVVDNGSDDLVTLKGLKAAETFGYITVIRDSGPFNYPRLNNAAACVAKGEFLVLLNNDVVVRDPSWLRELITEAAQKGTGVVGAKLLYPDDTVQHGGVVLGVQGGCAHAHRLLDKNEGGYMGLANLTHEVAATTGACLAVRRDLFLSVGGLDEAFRVAFNDVILCLDIHKKGFRNVYIGRPLITHHESKSRGFDDTPEKIRVWLSETKLAWAYHHDILRNDPFYSPNLSLEIPYRLSFAPRRRPAWRLAVEDALRVLVLSITYAEGHGVAVVIDQHVKALAAAGHEVILAGHRSTRDFEFAGRKIIDVRDPRDAATLACQLSADVIVAHTPPFFSVTRWTGAYPPTIVYDYGEPPVDLFPDAEARRAVGREKELAFLMATRVLAISEAVAAEADSTPDAVMPLANSHLGRWTASVAERREVVRSMRGWHKHFVVLNVCRFHAGERAYKGVDFFAELPEHLLRVDPSLAARTIFVLCGKGDADDIVAMQERELTLAANVSDEEMIDLYAAADAYANFSVWEGYNLGIGQALAMGLPVVASDIPAHRAFNVEVVSDATEAARVLARLHSKLPPRLCRVTEWDDVLPGFVREVEGVAAGRLGRTEQTPRGRRDPSLLRAAARLTEVALS